MIPRSLLATACCGVLLALGAGACEGEAPSPEPSTYAPTVDAGDEAFVHRAVVFLWGRRPLGIHEIEVLRDLVEATDRSTVAEAMARAPEGQDHWRATVLDLLGMPRLGGNNSRLCRGIETAAADSTALAEFVRDNDPRSQPGVDDGIEEAWYPADLAASSMLLDDVTPLMLGRLMSYFAMAEDTQSLLEELSQRQADGQSFNARWTGRRVDCLPCHNSEFSRTGTDDPATDRTWELPGLLEAALFGASDGGTPGSMWAFFRRYGVIAEYRYSSEPTDVEPMPDRGCWATDEPGCHDCECEDAVCEADPYCCETEWYEGCVDLCNEQGACAEPLIVQPWGTSNTCGRLLNPDVLAVDVSSEGGHFAGPAGPDLSIWDLEARLRAGFDGLRARGELEVAADGSVDPSEAFAYLTAANLANRVWAEAFGSKLTLDHGFSRNREQRDVLEGLTGRYISSGFSFSALLVAITEHPLFNTSPPLVTAAPGDSPYGLPPVFDPWSIEREAEDERGNSFGDTVHRLRGRALLNSLYGAMGWPRQREFHGYPDGGSGDQVLIQEILGVQLKDSLPGFRVVAMQTLLAWEEAFGTCRDTAPRDYGCVTNADWGCPDCPCATQVCEEHSQCCSPEGSWDDVCVASCIASQAGCGPPSPPPPDFIEDLVDAALDDGATLGDAVATLKDRLLADPRLTDRNERVVLSRLLEADLDGPVAAGADDQLRLACAVFVATPQFFLAGDPGEDRAGVPVPVDVPGAAWADHCEAISRAMYGGALSCVDGAVSLPVD